MKTLCALVTVSSLIALTWLPIPTNADGLPTGGGAAPSHEGEAPIGINSGMSGTWYDAAVPGQGFVIDVISSREELFVAWFTFDAGAARWLTAQGGYAGNRADLTVYETTGGEINEATPVETSPVGEARLEFSSCQSAQFAYEIDAKAGGQINLSRLSPDVLCHALEGQPSTPLYFHLQGEALTFDEDGNSADCRLLLIYEISVQETAAGRVVYHGVHGGLVQRTTLDPTGAGFSFSADVFDPDTGVTWSDPNRLLVSGPGVADDEHPLWRNLTTFEGVLDGAGRGVGGWSCAGFEFDPSTGYDDNGIVARGSWFIRPISDENQTVRRKLSASAGILTVRPVLGSRPEVKE